MIARGALLAVLGLAPWASAGSNAGATGAPILQLPVGARAAGMGTAFTGVADDVSALQYDPAGLANLGSREVTFMALDGGQDETAQYFAAGTPLPFSGLTGSGYSTLAASALFGQSGTIQVNPLNADGTAGPSSMVNAGGDTVLSLGYAERLADTPFETPDSTRHFDHFFGVSGKFIRSTLVQSYTAQTYAADLGYFGRCPELGLTVGASVLNLGGKVRFVSVGDPLPLTFRAGMGWTIPGLPDANRLIWANDGEYDYYERLWSVNTGVEYTLFKQFSARMGYQFHRDLAGFTMGFGARWRNWTLDYAWAMSSDLGDANRFSLTFRFGAVPVREREKPRRPFIESVPDEGELKQLEKEQPATFDQPQPPRQTAPAPAPAPPGAPGWIY